MIQLHGNDKDNQDFYHLYEMIDRETGLIFKYGISADPIEKDGMSKRLKEQIEYANLIVGWERFAGWIIRVNIEGNAKARIVEGEYINAFFVEYGKYPIGNRDRKRKKKE